MTLGLGSEPRSQAISASGEARFGQVPRVFDGLLVPVTVTCRGFRDLASVAVLHRAPPSDVVLEPVLPPAPATTRRGPCSITPGGIDETARTDCRLVNPVIDESLYDSIKNQELLK